MSLPISVFIIALNEADRIGRTIESVRTLADEVVVVDSGSTDGTQRVAERLGARVIGRAWPGYGPQKRFAEEQCSNNWLLNLDADEVLSPALAQEIAALFAQGCMPEHAAYRMKIREVLPGQRAPSYFAHGVSPVRLYDRRHGRYADSTVHDRVHMQHGSEGMLSGTVLHFSSRGIEHSIAKFNRYSTMQAEDSIARGKRVRLLGAQLVLIFPLAFCKAYFLRRGVLYGMPGFVNSVLYGASRFARLAKLWERRKPEIR